MIYNMKVSWFVNIFDKLLQKKKIYQNTYEIIIYLLYKICKVYYII